MVHGIMHKAGHPPSHHASNEKGHHADWLHNRSFQSNVDGERSARHAAGDPRGMPHGKIVHTVSQGETLGSVARDHHRSVGDLQTVNHLGQSHNIKVGDTIVVLNDQRTARMNAIHAIHHQIAHSLGGRHGGWVPMAVPQVFPFNALGPHLHKLRGAAATGDPSSGGRGPGAARFTVQSYPIIPPIDALGARDPQDQRLREALIARLRNHVMADFTDAARGIAHDPAGLKQALDARAADLLALGPRDAQFTRVVNRVRDEVEGNLNNVFASLRDKISHARVDPIHWDDAREELVRQFEALIEEDPDWEAAVNEARRALLELGPGDARYRLMVNQAAWQLLVICQAQRVIIAYQQGRTLAALDMLDEVTARVSHDLGFLIVHEVGTAGILARLLADLSEWLRRSGSVAAGGSEDGEDGGPSGIDTALIDLCAVTDRVSHSSHPRTAGLIADIAAPLADGAAPAAMGPEARTGRAEDVTAAFCDAAALGKGVTLQLAVAQLLAAKGCFVAAEAMLAAVLSGIETLLDRVRAAVDVFAGDHLVTPALWEDVYPGATQRALDAAGRDRPESWQRMDGHGRDMVLTLEAVDQALPALQDQGLDAQGRLAAMLEETDDKLTFAMANSAAAWNELARMHMQRAGVPSTAAIRDDPSWYWAERSAVDLQLGWSRWPGTTPLSRGLAGLQAALALLGGGKWLDGPAPYGGGSAVLFVYGGLCRVDATVGAGFADLAGTAGKMPGNAAPGRYAGWEQQASYAAGFRSGSFEAAAMTTGRSTSGGRLFGTFLSDGEPSGADDGRIALTVDFLLHDQEYGRRSAGSLAKATEAFLIAAGIRPGIARELAAWHHGDGNGFGPLLAALAEALAMTPAALMDHFNGSGPMAVRRFVDVARTLGDAPLGDAAGRLARWVRENMAL